MTHKLNCHISATFNFKLQGRREKPSKPPSSKPPSFTAYSVPPLPYQLSALLLKPNLSVYCVIVVAMNTSSQLRRTLLKRLPKRIQQSHHRPMGGGAAAAAAAAAPQPESQSMRARLWEGHSTKPEGWENTLYATYAASAIVITLALGFAPDSSIQSWASAEARVRLDLQEDGTLDKPEFGVHYNTIENVFDFESKVVDNPFNEDDDDDDDEDDDDEEEEDDDE